MTDAEDAWAREWPREKAARDRWNGDFYVSEGSYTGHCCFGFSVVRKSTDESVCETFDADVADRICRMLTGGDE